MMIRLAFLVLSLCLVDAASDVNTEGETGDREKPAADSSGSAYSHASVCSYCVYAKVRQTDVINQNSCKREFETL